MKIMKRFAIAMASLGLLLTYINCAYAGIEVIEARQGTLLCGGNYTRLTQTASWNVRNFNDDQSIFVDRVRFIDARGTLIYDSITNPAGIPLTNNGLLGGIDNELEPNQTTQFRSEQLVDAGLLPNLGGQDRRPIQVIIDWSSPSRVIGLDGSMVRRAHLVDTIEKSPEVFVDVRGREIGRHEYDCRTMERKGR